MIHQPRNAPVPLFGLFKEKKLHGASLSSGGIYKFVFEVEANNKIASKLLEKEKKRRIKVGLRDKEIPDVQAMEVYGDGKELNLADLITHTDPVVYAYAVLLDVNESDEIMNYIHASVARNALKFFEPGGRPRFHAGPFDIVR